MFKRLFDYLFGGVTMEEEILRVIDKPMLGLSSRSHFILSANYQVRVFDNILLDDGYLGRCAVVMNLKGGIEDIYDFDGKNLIKKDTTTFVLTCVERRRHDKQGENACKKM